MQTAPAALRKSALTVSKPQCVQCTHLIQFNADDLPEGAQAFDCRDSESCPAQAVMIVVGCNVQKAAASIFAAMQAGDAAVLAKRYTKLATYHSTVQADILTEVQRLVREESSPVPAVPALDAPADAGTLSVDGNGIVTETLPADLETATLPADAADDAGDLPEAPSHP